MLGMQVLAVAAVVTGGPCFTNFASSHNKLSPTFWSARLWPLICRYWQCWPLIGHWGESNIPISRLSRGNFEVWTNEGRPCFHWAKQSTHVGVSAGLLELPLLLIRAKSSLCKHWKEMQQQAFSDESALPCLFIQFINSFYIFPLQPIHNFSLRMMSLTWSCMIALDQWEASIHVSWSLSINQSIESINVTPSTDCCSPSK